ncbi:MAG: heavy metal-responsive transcriptional regulator [Gammaproteobacteria bacterium]|nr:heavy metal-responsive transcriptional regulator [Gammaproteobacteria bacterium]
MFTIGKLASQAELSIDAIRYYEKERLLRPARKTDAGYRLYDQNALRRIRFIKQAQHCGFSLTEIRELLALKKRDTACCNDVRTIAISKQAQLADKIKAMKTLSIALSKLIAICNDETKPIDECPILTALEASLGK